MRLVLLAAFGTLSFTAPSVAQVMIDVPIWSNGILGQQALRSTFDHYDETHGTSDNDAAPGKRARPCSADALPTADRRRMETEYVRRARSDGKASADVWVREQGMQFRQKLAAQGVC
ncbi:hypothetical protein M2341_000572 [Sphingobium sp. B7D2B]|uniref:hypothetical protein n=1 Tax=Sphingobium sp. B7D2B TaxID=2940583 RepID=UPI0022243761|nr:hypothetical protein [Sphingobium sp. B7D2B]MCW2365125.1 hypothetical protein [Sphingobium sp. B7D2B]